MENILEEMKTLVKSPKLNLKDNIQINDINKLLHLTGNNKPIPIYFYSKSLIEIKFKNKVKCFKCNQPSQYKYGEEQYCWSHAHNL